MNSTPSRRTVISAAGASGLAATTAAATGHAAPAPSAEPRSPFTLGIASGDPDPMSVVLWTRLALDPLADDGLGGFQGQPIEVEWRLATNEDFRDVVAAGTATTGPDMGYSVHVEPAGLAPDTWYYYQFEAMGFASQVGRTRTCPRAGSRTPLRMAVASCAQYEHGFFTAYRAIAEEGVDLVLHLGDYIYEHGSGGYPVAGGPARKLVGSETHTLADYRRRHAQYKTDADLQRAHASAPWLVVFDDHEVDNDWADLHHEVWGKTPQFEQRRADAFRAYYENMPLRSTALPKGPDMQLYRRIQWGALANLHMLDTRQYRSVHACRWVGPCEGVKDPERTMLGQAQEEWLARGLADSTATWDVLGNQVMFAQYDSDPGPLFITNPDGWDGYVPAKDRVLSMFAAKDTLNPVIFTGDYHKAFALDLVRTVDDAEAALGVEFVTTSITSGGDAKASPVYAQDHNPHLRFYDNHRGYVLAEIDTDQMVTSFRSVDTVRAPNSTVNTVARFRVTPGERAIRRT